MNYKVRIENLDCANCARNLEENLNKEKDLNDVVVNFNTSTIYFKASNKDDAIKKIIKITKKVEPNAKIIIDDTFKEKDYNLLRLIVGIILYVISFFINDPIKEVFIILAFIILLCRVFIVSIKLLIKQRTINENFLILISSIGAYFIDKKMEGLMVIILYEIGKILEKKAVNNTRKSIKDLMDLKTYNANKLVNGKIIVLSPEELEKDDIIIVKKGEKVPTDGILLSDGAMFNTAYITGESNVRLYKKDDKILSGFINNGDKIEIKVTCKYEDSTVKKILDLVENATNRKAKTENYVAKLAKIYTPLVFILAIIIFIVSSIITKNYSNSLYQALVLLVISCPCSIAISVPLSYFTGIGKASKEGILIKGSDYLDSLKDINEIIFDKTGTLTKGVFTIKDVKVYDKYTKDEILSMLYQGEAFSNHPIAMSIINNKKDIDTSKVKNFKEVSGKGISYKIGNKEIKVGSKVFCNAKEDKENALYMNINDKVVAMITLSDEIKEGTKEALKKLKKQNINIRMFTGDKESIAKEIKEELAIDSYISEMLPQDKYDNVEKVIKNNKNGKVCFVGDGINDAPVLALADIGISMGNVGAASSMEASDIIIMQDNLDKINTAIVISNKTRRIIKQNLIFAISTKIIILILNLLGLANMWAAVFADVGTTLITILNTTRILKLKVK